MNDPRIIKFAKTYLAAILIVLFFATEAISKYSIIFLDGKSDVQKYVKLIALVFLGISTIRPWQNLLLPSLVIISFCLGQFFLPNGFNPEIVVSAGKFLLPIILFIYFTKYPMSEKGRNFFFLTFEYLLLLSGVLIVLGFLWDLPLFRSYKYGRWGYNGLFISTATSSYVYAIAIFYFLLKLQKNFLNNWKTYFIIVCALLTGTKIIYLALVASLLIYLCFFVNFNRRNRRILILGVVAIFIFIGYFFFFQYGIFNEIRQEQGLFSAIFSFRDDLLMEQTLPFIEANWTWPNYLFGGVSDLSDRSQMGFIDVFFFWGILGGLLYLFTFYKTFVSFPLTIPYIYILLSMALMVFLAGNFFENASMAIYLLVLREKLEQRSTFLAKKPLHE